MGQVANLKVDVWKSSPNTITVNIHLPDGEVVMLDAHKDKQRKTYAKLQKYLDENEHER